jgi:flagellar P-ring protein precursor FlgI
MDPRHPTTSPRRPRRAALAAALLGLAAAALPGEARADRIGDLCEILGARDNQLVGYGLVTGLAGTGDDTSVPFAAQSVVSMLKRLGVQVDPRELRLRNVAAVAVTATLPPFAKPGTKVDVVIASIGNAKSLSGGVLVQTPLRGADQKTYAVAQGAITVGGFGAKGASGSSLSNGTTTSGRIAAGAIVEREVQQDFSAGQSLKLALRNPSFVLASRAASAIDAALGEGTATALDGGSVLVKIPESYMKRTVELAAKIEEIDVAPVRRARVVVSERTGTIVAGGDVRLAPSVVVNGGLTIVVKEAPVVSQPPPLTAGGKAEVVPRTDITTQESKGPVQYVPEAPALADVASALGRLGLAPRELISVVEALRAAGALEAEVIVQ